MPEDNNDELIRNIGQDGDSVPEETPVDNGEAFGDNWDWDAQVPETSVDNIEFNDLLPEDTTPAEDDEAETEAQTETEDEDETGAEENAGEPEERVCIVCGNKLGDSPSELYCDDCRKKYLRTNYGVGHIILAFVMVLIAAIGYFVCTATFEIASQVKASAAYAADKQYNSAIDEYEKVKTTVSTVNSGVNAVFKGINSDFSSKEWFTEGSRMSLIMIEAYCDTLTLSSDSCYNYIDLVDKVFDGSGLDINNYPKIKKCYDFCNDINSITEGVTDTLNDYISGDGSEDYKIPYDEVIDYLESVKTENDYQKSMIYYYESVIAYYAEKDSKTILNIYQKAYDLSGDFGYAYAPSYIGLSWEIKEYDKALELSKASIERNVNDITSYYYAIKSYIVKNDFDSADSLCEEMKMNNPDSIDYYSMKAEILRRQSKFEEAINICKKGIEKGSDAELQRQQAIAYMLLNDNEKALEAAKESYNITLQNAASDTSVSLEALNTAALITYLCNDKTTYDEIYTLFKDQSVEFFDSVKDCISGKITFEQIFMEGTGDVE